MAQSYVAFGGAETSRRLAADGQGTLASPLVPLFGFGAPRKIGLRYPITLNAAGAARSLGTLSVLATGYTGTAPCRVTINWREVR